MSHILVTNDFPPKTGGIQTYLWELWRRLPAGECAAVVTTAFPGAEGFDDAAPMRVVRSRSAVLWPTASLARTISNLASETGASLAVIDPALPLGLVGARLSVPYAVVVHGAEITVPGRLPVSHALLARALRPACGIIAAGNYPAAESARAVRPRAARPRAVRPRGESGRNRWGVLVSTPGWPSGGAESPITAVVLPGVDTQRFRPLTPAGRAEARGALGLPLTADLVVSVSRLVPRKGMDTLIAAAAQLAPSRPGLLVAIAGEGRDRGRLESLAARSGAPVRFLGRIDDEKLPLFYGCADVFVMACRDRWAGLEQEGFGVVFLEAAACGVPQIAGRSGGSHEAVDDGVTGRVLARSDDADELARVLGSMVEDPSTRATMGRASRRRTEESFGYDRLAGTLLEALHFIGGGS